jgi:phospholipid/cholesterol/gamma-HCH transport system substrate-binding protein
MSRRKVEIKVGALLIVALLLLFSGYTWYSGYRVGKTGYNVRVHFPDVTGLLPGDDVRVAGVKKGKVESISLEGKVVEVKLWLDSDVELYEDASFSILDVALISGTKYIAVIPGPEQTLSG